MAFYLTLRTLLTSIMFEHDSFKANDWIVSRVLHSSIVMCELGTLLAQGPQNAGAMN